MNGKKQKGRYQALFDKKQVWVAPASRMGANFTSNDIFAKTDSIEQASQSR